MVFVFYRNRLENNSEHWNALLLSLRELTEWVIRKDTELSSLVMGPVRGDAASLQKQLVSNILYKILEKRMLEFTFIIISIKKFQKLFDKNKFGTKMFIRILLMK